MKKFLIFIVLIIFVANYPSELKREEQIKNMTECILKNETASSELKQIVEENKDGNLMKALNSNYRKLKRIDRDVFRHCRKLIFEKKKEVNIDEL